AALWISRQIAQALAALHRAGFVHGDVKPDNVLLIDSHAAMLIDLGLAHRPGGNRQFLRHGFLLGTAAYLAPESWVADSSVDERADLFSLGVTLFEMLAGRLPYSRGAMAEAIDSHRHEFPAGLHEVAGRWPAGLPELVRGMMARRPFDRPRAATVVEDLISLELALLQRQAA